MRAIDSAQCYKIGFLTWPPVQRLLSSVAALFECRWARQLGQFSDLRLLNCPAGMIKTAWVDARIFYVLSLRLCLQHKHHLCSTGEAKRMTNSFTIKPDPGWVGCALHFSWIVLCCVCVFRNRWIKTSALAAIESVWVWKLNLLVATQAEQPAVDDGAGLITSNLTSCLMNTGTSFSGNEFSLENCGSHIQVYLNEVTWGR